MSRLLPSRVFGRTAALTALALAAGVGPALSPAPASATPPRPTPVVTVSPADAPGGPRMAARGVVVAPDAPRPPQMRNVSWLVADLDSGEVLAAKAPHARLRPASTLKTLTALTLLPRIAPDRKYRVTDADAMAEGTRVGLVPGQWYRGDELFNALLMSSGNDAAYALARIGGGEERTLAAMNAQARRLGAFDTRAADPAGLDAPGQLSSAYDLALIAREAMRDPRFRAHVARRSATLPGIRHGGRTSRFVISNHNPVLYNYPGAIGIKNGYTIKANHTLISAVRRHGRTLLVTQMSGADGGWRPTAALYDWAFANLDRLTPVGHLVTPEEVSAATVSRSGSRPQTHAAATQVVVPGPGRTPPGTSGATPPLTPAGLWGAAGVGGAAILTAAYARRRPRHRSRHGHGRRG